MNSHFQPQYRAEITLSQPKCVVTVTGENLPEVKATITQLLKGKAVFDAEQDNNTILVFDPQELTEPIGFVAKYNTPNHLSVTNRWQGRKPAERAA